MTERRRAAFTPDHFNDAFLYAFLQNQDRHVYLHVLPRYARPREVVGLRLVDAEYPDQYAVPAPTRPVPPAVLEELARRLRPATPI